MDEIFSFTLERIICVSETSFLRNETSTGASRYSEISPRIVSVVLMEAPTTAIIELATPSASAMISDNPVFGK